MRGVSIPHRSPPTPHRSPEGRGARPHKSVHPEPVEGSPPPTAPASPSPTSVIPAQAGIQRGEARGVSHPIAPPLPVVDTPPAPVRPEPVEGNPPPPATPASPSPARVIPAKAGIQGRGAGRLPSSIASPTPHRQARLQNPFALSLSNPLPHPPVLRPRRACPEGTRRGPSARVIPAKAGIQRGEARGVSHLIASPTPTKGALPKSVRPEPVEGSPPPTAPASPLHPRLRVNLTPVRRTAH